jgi:hypothetical protein
MPQYPIPQFIEQEGKIISFLTFKQFFVLVGGGAFCLLFYFVFPTVIFIFLSLIAVFMVAIIAFIKIENTPVINIILNFINFSTKSKNYTWKKKESAYPWKTKNTLAVNSMEPGKTNIQQVQGMVEYKKR